MTNKKLVEKVKETKIEDKVFLKSYQKNIQLKDGKLFDGDTEIDLTIRTVDGDISGDKKNPEQEGYRITREFYKKFIARPFENVIVLTGAGTSKSSGGKVMLELWDEAFPVTNKTEDEKFFKSINFPVPTKDSEKNLEELLSQAQKAIGVLEEADSKKVETKIQEVEALVVKACTLPLKSDSPHLTLLNKITSRKLKYSRVKIFTLNYDTLFEQAAADGHFVTINGFSFSNPSYFNGTFFDYDVVNRKDSRVSPEENFIGKVFHLYKPHGSINWEKDASGKIVARDITKAADKPLIIYPNSNKYESGYDQPFFEMMSRFQQAVRQPNTLLLCVGFSFGDKHFKNVIQEAVKSNPGLNFILAAPNFSQKESLKDLIQLTEKQNNVFLVNEDFQNLSENYPFSFEYNHDDDE